VKWRRIKGRFGISAPKLAIRPHVPWYWRAVVWTIVLAMAVALGLWVYDAGRSLAGFDWRESEQVLTELKAEITRLQEENDQLRKSVNASASTMQIEQTAQQHLTEQMRHLVAENGQLKEELAVFESLASGGAKTATATISRLAVEQDGTTGQYRYHVLLTSGSAQGDRELVGNVQLAISGQQGGKAVMLTYPASGEKENKVSFRRFLRHTGAFKVPADFHLKEVEASLVVGGSAMATTKFVP